MHVRSLAGSAIGTNFKKTGMFPTFPEAMDVTPEEFKRIAEGLVSQVAKACRLKPLPPTLYHYTTPAGFKGIIESGVLRATHISYTNDRIELLHAVEVARLSARARQQTATDQQEKNLLAAMERDLGFTNPFNTFPIAISCFCEDGDLLSQWRGYGLGEGGIAIGFDTKKMLPAIREAQGFLAPVIYNDEQQQLIASGLVENIISEYNAILKSRSIKDSPAHIADYLTAWAVFSTYLGPLVKHRGFAEENEWRIIYRLQNLAEVQFLAKASHLSPTVNLKIGTKRENRPDMLPISEVWFGPGRYQEHAQHSCGALLSALEYYNIPLSVPKRRFGLSHSADNNKRAPCYPSSWSGRSPSRSSTIAVNQL